MEGNPDLNSYNSFGVLSNKEIMLRASRMGVDFPNNNFKSIDLLRELVKARDQLAVKNMNKEMKKH